MIYTFVMFRDRAEVLVSELKDIATLGDDHNEEMVTVTINIESGSELLRIFHAGTRFGLKLVDKFS